MHFLFGEYWRVLASVGECCTLLIGTWARSGLKALRNCAVARISAVALLISPCFVRPHTCSCASARTHTRTRARTHAQHNTLYVYTHAESRTVERCLKGDLDKSEQMSDWERRSSLALPLLHSPFPDSSCTRAALTHSRQAIASEQTGLQDCKIRRFQRQRKELFFAQKELFSAHAPHRM